MAEDYKLTERDMVLLELMLDESKAEDGFFLLPTAQERGYLEGIRMLSYLAVSLMNWRDTDPIPTQKELDIKMLEFFTNYFGPRGLVGFENINKIASWYEDYEYELVIGLDNVLAQFMDVFTPPIFAPHLQTFNAVYSTFTD